MTIMRIRKELTLDLLEELDILTSYLTSQKHYPARKNENAHYRSSSTFYEQHKNPLVGLNTFLSIKVVVSSEPSLSRLNTS